MKLLWKGQIEFWPCDAWKRLAVLIRDSVTWLSCLASSTLFLSSLCVFGLMLTWYRLLVQFTPKNREDYLCSSSSSEADFFLLWSSWLSVMKPGNRATSLGSCLTEQEAWRPGLMDFFRCIVVGDQGTSEGTSPGFDSRKGTWHVLPTVGDVLILLEITCFLFYDVTTLCCKTVQLGLGTKTSW